MKFALAGYLGRTVAELEATMDADEFGAWVALLGVEPWGGYRLDALSAMEQSATLAPWAKKIKLADLLPRWGQGPVKRKTWKESLDDFFRSVRGLGRKK